MPLFPEAQRSENLLLPRMEIDPKAKVARDWLGAALSGAYQNYAADQSTDQQRVHVNTVYGMLFERTGFENRAQSDSGAHQVVSGLIELVNDGLEEAASANGQRHNRATLTVARVAMEILLRFGEENGLPIQQAMSNYRAAFLERKRIEQERCEQENSLFTIPGRVRLDNLRDILASTAMPSGEAEALPADKTADIEAVAGEKTRPVEKAAAKKEPVWIKRVLAIGEELIWRSDEREADGREKLVSRLQIAQALALAYLNGSNKERPVLQAATFRLFGSTEELGFDPQTKMASGSVLVKQWEQYRDELLKGEAPVEVHVSLTLLREIIGVRLQAFGVEKLPEKLFANSHFQKHRFASGLFRPELLVREGVAELEDRVEAMRSEEEGSTILALIEALGDTLPGIKGKQADRLISLIETKEKTIRAGKERAQLARDFFAL